MPIEERKRTISMHPISLLVCFVCLIGLSVSAAFLIMRAKYQSQLDDKNQKVLSIQKNYEALSHQNLELSHSLQRWEDEYNKLRSRYKDLESRLDAAEQKNMQTTSELATDSEEMQVLKPCVGSGETTFAFDGNLRIVIHKASEKDECEKVSAAVGYLTSDTDKKKLCLRTGKPKNFTYQGKNYLFNLYGIAAHASVYHYCISIFKER